MHHLCSTLTTNWVSVLITVTTLFEKGTDIKKTPITISREAFQAWVGLIASQVTKTKNKMKYMKTLNYSLRYLLKNRGNSLTRLVSLALGLIVALLICSYVGINLSYGRFFPNRERVYHKLPVPRNQNPRQ